MAIHKMNFADEVFFAKQVDYVDNVDAKMWVSALGKYAKNSASPIMAVVDASEVNRFCPTVVKLFAEALNLPNVRGIAIVTGDLMASQKARVVGSLSEIENIRIFSTTEDAQRFAQSRLHAPVGRRVGSAQAFSSMRYAWVG
jgi:hypothetical protein